MRIKLRYELYTLFSVSYDNTLLPDNVVYRYFTFCFNTMNIKKSSSDLFISFPIPGKYEPTKYSYDDILSSYQLLLSTNSLSSKYYCT